MLDTRIARQWDDDIVPQLVDYIRIPNKSPMFDADWVAHGYMDAAVALMERWARAQGIPGMTVDVVRLDGRTSSLPGGESITITLAAEFASPTLRQ